MDILRSTELDISEDFLSSNNDSDEEIIEETKSYFRTTEIYGGISEFLSAKILNDNLIGQYRSGGLDKVNKNEYYILILIKLAVLRSKYQIRWS